MNGFTEPLPGLLDDPQFQIPNLPSLPDLHIAPLRNPAPSKHGKGLRPLEPLTKPSEDHRHGAGKNSQHEEEVEKISPPRLRPSDVLSAREAKKPHLAISELVDSSNEGDAQYLQLPSFVSLAVVEKSPIQEPSHLSPHKRLRLDLEVDVVSSREVGRRLPRPPQKDDTQPRRVPLLPAMVTGLHEPPPSAGILPSMELDAGPSAARTTKSSKIQVKDILAESKRSTHVPPEAMLNTPDLPAAQLVKPTADEAPSASATDSGPALEATIVVPKKDPKTRRARRKWTEEETADLLAGVQKHGFGKWKQILTDAMFTFYDRTSIDLKDRYRVFSKDQPEIPTSTTQSSVTTQPESSPRDKDGHVSSSQTPAVTPDKPTVKRKRRPWTQAEDAALLRGVSKHGFQWTVIHDDQELDLAHRRATDLRDRIRNLYPEGYKQAEARPLRSEVKKSDKSTQEQDAASSDAASKATTNTKWTIPVVSQEAIAVPSESSQSKRREGRGKSLKTSGDPHQAAEQVGVTLPSLALDDDGELDWEDNTLPPLLEWEEIGM